MGYGPGFMREAAEINPVLFQKTWPDWLSASGRRALQQIGRFELGDGMDEEGGGMLAYKFSEQEQPPQELSRIAVAAGDSHQATDGLRPLMPRAPAETLAITGLAALAGLLFFGSLWRRPDLWWPALLFLAAYAGNAALIGLGGEVHDRYGARLVWLAPLLAALLALRGARPAGAEDGSDQRRPR
jgi:hypothetical protein